MKFKGYRKLIGYLGGILFLFIGAFLISHEIYSTYARYIFLISLVFMGGNAIEHVKELIKRG